LKERKKVEQSANAAVKDNNVFDDFKLDTLDVSGMKAESLDTKVDFDGKFFFVFFCFFFFFFFFFKIRNIAIGASPSAKEEPKPAEEPKEAAPVKEEEKKAEVIQDEKSKAGFGSKAAMFEKMSTSTDKPAPTATKKNKKKNKKKKK
jgi:hypothetical protein